MHASTEALPGFYRRGRIRVDSLSSTGPDEDAVRAREDSILVKGRVFASHNTDNPIRLSNETRLVVAKDEFTQQNEGL